MLWFLLIILDVEGNGVIYLGLCINLFLILEVYVYKLLIKCEDVIKVFVIYVVYFLCIFVLGIYLSMK